MLHAKTAPAYFVTHRYGPRGDVAMLLELVANLATQLWGALDDVAWLIFGSRRVPKGVGAPPMALNANVVARQAGTVGSMSNERVGLAGGDSRL
jgi:hypothetical protein